MKQGTNQAIRFYVMESLKELYRGKDNVNKPVPKPITGLFGIVAGAASVFGNTPLDVIKTRMQVCHAAICYISRCIGKNHALVITTSRLEVEQNKTRLRVLALGVGYIIDLVNQVFA